MRFLHCAVVLAVGFLGVFGLQARADQVFLKDGSVLVGAVKSLAEASLTLETAFGGELAIPWEHVTGMSTDSAVVLRLQSGESVTGALQFVEGTQLIQKSPEERVPVALAEVAGLALEGQEPAAAAPAADEPAPAETAPEEPKASWAGRAEMGLNGQSGNKERFDVRGNIEAERKTELTRLSLYLKGQYAETNSDRSASEAMAGARLEVDFSERTYVFGKLDLEYDEFENLDLRTTLTSGFGHYFVKRDKIELKGWAGAGYEHERFDDEEDDAPGIAATTSLETAVRDAVQLAVREEITRLFYGDDEDRSTSEVVVELGYNYRHDIRKNFRLKHGLTYYPSVDDPAKDYRLAADTSLEFPLGKDPDWTLRTGVRHEYDAMPQEAVDKLDTTYYLNLGYNF